MIFIDILNTFYSLLLQVAPWLAVSLLLTALAAEFFPVGVLNRLLKGGEGHDVPIAVSYSAILPATTAYKVLVAAFSRRSGSKWTPVLSFIVGGAGSGLAVLSVTMMLGWQMAAIRFVAALLVGLVVSVVFAKQFEQKLAATATDFEVESLLTRDFIEIGEENLTKEEKPKLVDLWNSIIRITRISVPWFVLSLFIATLIKTIVPDFAIQMLIGGNLGILWVTLLGIPFYLIGGAEIPIVYVLMQEGMGLGGAVVLMLAAPLVNIPVYVIMARWLGYRMTSSFMAISWLMIVIAGVVVGISVR